MHIPVVDINQERIKRLQSQLDAWRSAALECIQETTTHPTTMKTLPHASNLPEGNGQKKPIWKEKIEVLKRSFSHKPEKKTEEQRKGYPDFTARG
jgi:hypothetical protein